MALSTIKQTKPKHCDYCHLNICFNYHLVNNIATSFKKKIEKIVILDDCYQWSDIEIPLTDRHMTTSRQNLYHNYDWLYSWCMVIFNFIMHFMLDCTSARHIKYPLTFNMKCKKLRSYYICMLPCIKIKSGVIYWGLFLYV